VRDSERRAPEMEHLSVQELCLGNLKEGLLYWGSRRLWRQALSLHGGPAREPGNGIIYQGL